jgi:hypothetical protein
MGHYKTKNERGLTMESLAIFGIMGFAFAATTGGALVYEHRSDVLNGPYIEGRERPRAIAAILDFVRAVGEAMMEHLNWKARNAVYLASLA